MSFLRLVWFGTDVIVSVLESLMNCKQIYLQVKKYITY